MKTYFILLALVSVLGGGCATSNRSNTSDKPWDHPVAADHPGFDAPRDPGGEDDAK